jgi:protease I
MAKPTIKKAVVLTADKFEDMEVYVPVFRLREAGWQGENGYSLEPNITIDEVNPDDYDLLIIPGGFPDGAPATVRKMKKALEITRSFFAKDKPVASICHGPWTLASADVIKGRHLTSYWHDGVPKDIKKAGRIWEDKDVVVDGNLVTSRWPFDLAAFNSEMMKLVNK